MFNLTWGDGLLWVSMILINVLIYFLVKFKIKQAFDRGKNLGQLTGHGEGFKEGHNRANDIWRVRISDKIRTLKHKTPVEK